MTFEEARAQFPVLDHLAFLNAGTFGPLAQSTANAMREQQLRELEQGRVGRPYFDEALASRDELRVRLAGLLCVEPLQVALTTSTTDAVNVVIAGLGLGPGDEVVTTAEEHFGLLGPLHASGAEVVVAPADPESILGSITPRTRLIAISQVLWTTGRVLPVAELRARSGLPLLADGAQSVGAIPVDAGGVDFFTVSGQKWLCGPDATGALVVRDPGRLRLTRPTYFGKEGDHDVDGTFSPKEGAGRFDTGAQPLPTLKGMLAALDIAPDWRFTRAAEAAQRCRTLLGSLVPVEPSSACLVSFRPDGESAEDVVTRLRGAGVLVRDIPGAGLVRVSCGWWTSDGDLQRLLDALAS